MDESPGCAHCGDEIGLYEPTVVVQSSDTREASDAAGTRTARQVTRHYHRACHDAVRSVRSTKGTQALTSPERFPKP